MLENFTNEEIGDLLDTGCLYLEFDGKQKRIGITAQKGVAPQINRYALQKDGEHARTYETLIALLQCEAITYDDIRASWRYRGILLGSTKFCEKLVHDDRCFCVICEPAEIVHPLLGV